MLFDFSLRSEARMKINLTYFRRGEIYVPAHGERRNIKTELNGFKWLRSIITKQVVFGPFPACSCTLLLFPITQVFDQGTNYNSYRKLALNSRINNNLFTISVIAETDFFSSLPPQQRGKRQPCKISHIKM